MIHAPPCVIVVGHVDGLTPASTTIIHTIIFAPNIVRSVDIGTMGIQRCLGCCCCCWNLQLRHLLLQLRRHLHLDEW